jgi:hypothetical protein
MLATRSEKGATTNLMIALRVNYQLNIVKFIIFLKVALIFAQFSYHLNI